MANRKHFIALAAAIFAATGLGAQSFQESLFLDGYRLGYRYNPALQNSGSFLSVGQWVNQTRNNIGAASFLYPRDGEVVTALHSSVSADEFLGSLKDDNYLCGNISFNLFSYGWWKNDSYRTLEANIRSVYAASIPKEIFAIAKLGTDKTNYDISGARLSGNAYMELAYGYSRKLSDLVSAGVRAKLLVGVESINYNITRFDMEMGEDEYKATVEADLDLTSRWRKIRPDDEGYLSLKNLSAKDRWRLPSGAGLAFDLGVTLTPAEGLTVSAAALDLGGILWYYGNAGKSQGTTTFSGVEQLSTEEIKEGKISEHLKKVRDDFFESLKIKSVKDRLGLEAIPLNLNLAARYELPSYRKLSLGLTGNYVGFKGMSYVEGRALAAWSPWEWLGIVADGGTGNYGAVYGFAVNARVHRFRITVGQNNGTGGTVPYTSTPLKANNKITTVGLTYDL